MCCRSLRPAPLPRAALGVRIDLTSPWDGDSSLSAPHPSNCRSSQIVQTVLSGTRSFAGSSANTCSGGDNSCMLSRCSCKSACTCGRKRSSISICILISDAEVYEVYVKGDRNILSRLFLLDLSTGGRKAKHFLYDGIASVGLGSGVVHSHSFVPPTVPSYTPHKAPAANRAAVCARRLPHDAGPGAPDPITRPSA